MSCITKADIPAVSDALAPSLDTTRHLSWQDHWKMFLPFYTPKPASSNCSQNPTDMQIQIGEYICFDGGKQVATKVTFHTES